MEFRADKDLAKRIEELCRSHQQTPSDIARFLDVREPVAASLLDGSRRPTVRELLLLADHFSVDVNSLLTSEASLFEQQSSVEFTAAASVESLFLVREMIQDYFAGEALNR